MPTPDPQLPPQDLERLFSAERLSTYIDHCGGDFAAAVEMYRWNSAITAAFWEPVGHLEVALRNTLDDRLATRALRRSPRPHRLHRPGSTRLDSGHQQGPADAQCQAVTVRPFSHTAACSVRISRNSSGSSSIALHRNMSGSTTLIPSARNASVSKRVSVAIDSVEVKIRTGPSGHPQRAGARSA
jgi:hypothetical protein